MISQRKRSFIIKSVLIASFVACCLFSCKKSQVSSPATLPAVSTIGANVFGTYVDQNLWLPHTSGDPSEANLCVTFSNGDLRLSANCDDITEESDEETIGNHIVLVYKGISSPNDYDLSDVNKAFVQVIDQNTDDPNDTFQVVSGKLSILKLDLANNIISGVFNCTVEDKTSGITHEIKNARFDVQIGYCQ